MDLQKFKNKIDDNESANDILDEKIANLFEEYPEFKEKYSYLLKNDSFSSLRPWIYRALIDQKPCINCQNFYSCPKGKRRGYYFGLKVLLLLKIQSLDFFVILINTKKLLVSFLK